jgi:hypothetical protein
MLVRPKPLGSRAAPEYCSPFSTPRNEKDSQWSNGGIGRTPEEWPNAMSDFNHTRINPATLSDIHEEHLRTGLARSLYANFTMTMVATGTSIPMDICVWIMNSNVHYDPSKSRDPPFHVIIWPLCFPGDPGAPETQEWKEIHK